MKASETLPSCPPARAQRPTPVTIGRIAGWLHPGRSDGAVLMCGSIGFEALCCRQSWNVLADLIAAEGLTALRFDYPGEGDSLDRSPGETVSGAAIAAIAEAERWLRALGGIRRVGLVGMRMGAPLMLEAFAGRDDFEAVALLAPVSSGRHYLRETRMTARVIAEMRPGQTAAENEINLCGFVLDAASVRAIEGCVLPAPPPAARILVAPELDRPTPAFAGDVAGASRLAERPFERYAEMNRTPTHSTLPLHDFHAFARWLAEGARPGLATPPQAPAVMESSAFRETALRLGADGELAGVLCEPRTQGAQRPLVHLLNAGANFHAGWARMAVSHARALAEQGVASLRYDFSGIGDSVWFEDGPRSLIYSPRHIADALGAVEEMSRRGFETHVVSGLCAGGYVAFHAAARDERIVGAVVANAIRLVWHAHDNLDALENEMIQPRAVYQRKALSPAEWKRLLAGEIGVARIARIVRAFAAKAAHRLAARFGAGALVDADTHIVREALKKSTDRGARIVFIHAERDQSRDETERHFGTGGRFALAQPGVSLIDIPDCDHELTPQAARDVLLETILSLACRDEKAGANGRRPS